MFDPRLSVRSVLFQLILFYHIFSVNGEVIVTLLPVNERLPWVTPAKFRPELVPEELMAPILTVITNNIATLFYLLTT